MPILILNTPETIKIHWKITNLILDTGYFPNIDTKVNIKKYALGNN